uniref:Uncharacterized protein n=1 Tax=Seriola dumerili TaxID=41447 RepID=A0A3B4UEU5_SERDU
MRVCGLRRSLSLPASEHFLYASTRTLSSRRLSMERITAPDHTLLHTVSLSLCRLLQPAPSTPQLPSITLMVE